MATEKRIIEIIECLKYCADNSDCKKCLRWLHSCERHCVDDLMVTAAEALEKLVDAVEVVHGRWVDNHCTACGMMPMGEELWLHLDCEPPRMERFMDYCPNCGAKMDGDGNG